MFQMISKFFLLIVLIRLTMALIGYDCSRPYVNGTVVSLTEIKECRMPTERHSLHNVYMELLRLPVTPFVSVLACRTEIENTVINGKDNINQPRVENYRFYLPVDLVTCVTLHNQ